MYPLVFCLSKQSISLSKNCGSMEQVMGVWRFLVIYYWSPQIKVDIYQTNLQSPSPIPELDWNHHPLLSNILLTPRARTPQSVTPPCTTPAGAHLAIKFFSSSFLKSANYINYWVHRNYYILHTLLVHIPCGTIRFCPKGKKYIKVTLKSSIGIKPFIPQLGLRQKPLPVAKQSLWY